MSRPESPARLRWFPPSSPSSLDGIIAYLSRQCNGNVHTKGILTITGHPYSTSPIDDALNAANLAESSFFASKDEEDQSLTYDFGYRRVRLSHYAIRSQDEYYLRSWVIEGADDDQNWTDLDRRQDEDTLNSGNRTHVFEAHGQTTCRFVRIRQTGANHHVSHPNHQLVISGFELFGSLRE
jgi:hypothetical protein